MEWISRFNRFEYVAMNKDREYTEKSVGTVKKVLFLFSLYFYFKICFFVW